MSGRSEGHRWLRARLGSLSSGSQVRRLLDGVVGKVGSQEMVAGIR